MKTYSSIFNFHSTKKTILTLGTFDGVHLGHQAIIQKLKNATANSVYESVVLTFFPHPRMVLKQDDSIKLINTLDEKAVVLVKFGIDTLIIHPFDETFSKLSAEEFVQKILVEQLNIQKIIVGYDHRFGSNRSANYDDLVAFGKKYHFEVEQISAKEIDDISVSSTKIRTALLDGDIAKANQYLGYLFSFSGQVVNGKKNGRAINFPTANLQIKDFYKLIPKSGVYIVSSTIDSVMVFGMMNIGTNPTFGKNEQTIEVHFFNFSEDIYNRDLTVSIIAFIRDEQKFESLNALKAQLEKDRAFSINYLTKHNKVFFK